MVLTASDFPLIAIGSLVYSRMMSSALFVAPNDQLAADLVMRLNRDEMSKWGPSEYHSQHALVYG
jgi:hypothetical protein